ncbi:kelch domain-containing protein 3-like [Adelges cooleyi]|uniref:kelch domain-containing protein 3-like n=1 Tax=Adelges cooleyi TaxID=133065 RepID=UPI00217FDED4|nr:kelch domain-containing protein 3-like [Adelges cooleyi]
MYWTVHLHGGPRRVNHAAVVVGTNIITFGGDCSGADDDGPIDIYALDTVKLKWWKIEGDENNENAPFQRSGFTTVVYDKKIYLWGGSNDSRVCNTLYCFDTETLKWSIPDVRGTKPAPRSGHSACMIGRRMYIYGGCHDGQFSQELSMFDFGRMRWHRIRTENDPPSFRDFHTASAVGDRMYIFGGRGGHIVENEIDHEIYCSDVHYYDTKLNIWVRPTVQDGYKPPGRRNHSTFVHNQFLYLYGGFEKNENTHFEDIYRYNVVSSTWSKVSPVGTAPCARRRHICLLVNDKVFVYGGLSPISDNHIISMRRSRFRFTSRNRLKHHDDLHVLDLNPSLKDMCLVKVCEYVDEGDIIAPDDLVIPATLQKDLAFFQPLEIFNLAITDTEDEDEEQYELFFPP